MNNRYRNKGDGLAVAALVCGILGCLLMCSIILGIVFGALAIILALLARGDSLRLTKQNRVGFILGLLAIIFAVIIFAVSMHNIIVNYGSIEGLMNEVSAIMNESFMEMYGLTFDEMMQMQ